MTNNNLKIAFFGTPEFATETLSALAEAGYNTSAIITQPDRPLGRKHAMTPSPVKVWALAHNVPVVSLTDIEQIQFDLGIVVAYGNIIPRKILGIPKYGIINIHYSLLPKYRGASPVQAALLAGDTETGVTIATLEKKLDRGPILAKVVHPIAPNDTYNTLHPKLVRLGNDLLIKTLEDYLAGKTVPQTQEHSKATYCGKIDTSDGLIDLADPVRSDRIVRALNPNPGAYFVYKNKRIKVLSGHISDELYIPEKIIPEGGREMTWGDFKRGNKI